MAGEDLPISSCSTVALTSSSWFRSLDLRRRNGAVGENQQVVRSGAASITDTQTQKDGLGVRGECYQCVGETLLNGSWVHVRQKDVVEVLGRNGDLCISEPNRQCRQLWYSVNRKRLVSSYNRLPVNGGWPPIMLLSGARVPKLCRPVILSRKRASGSSDLDLRCASRPLVYDRILGIIERHRWYGKKQCSGCCNEGSMEVHRDLTQRRALAPATVSATP